MSSSGVEWMLTKSGAAEGWLSEMTESQWGSSCQFFCFTKHKLIRKCLSRNSNSKHTSENISTECKRKLTAPWGWLIWTQHQVFLHQLSGRHSMRHYCNKKEITNYSLEKTTWITSPYSYIYYIELVWNIWRISNSIEWWVKIYKLRGGGGATRMLRVHWHEVINMNCCYQQTTINA